MLFQPFVKFLVYVVMSLRKKGMQTVYRMPQHF